MYVCQSLVYIMSVDVLLEQHGLELFQFVSLGNLYPYSFCCWLNRRGEWPTLSTANASDLKKVQNLIFSRTIKNFLKSWAVSPLL